MRRCNPSVTPALGMVWAMLLLAPGCGNEPTRVPVTGVVIYQDKPLGYGGVMFQPLAGGTPSRGTIQPDGTFSLATPDGAEGVVTGPSRVRITAFAAQQGRGGTGRGGEPALGESAIPLKYTRYGTSGITVDVTPEMELPLRLELE